MDYINESYIEPIIDLKRRYWTERYTNETYEITPEYIDGYVDGCRGVIESSLRTKRGDGTIDYTVLKSRDNNVIGYVESVVMPSVLLVSEVVYDIDIYPLKRDSLLDAIEGAELGVESIQFECVVYDELQLSHLRNRGYTVRQDIGIRPRKLGNGKFIPYFTYERLVSPTD